VLVRRAGGTEVAVIVSPDGVSAAVPGREARFRARKMKFRDAARLIAAPPPGERCYVMQQPAATLPLLGPDVTPPPFVPAAGLFSTNLWFGAEGVVTPLHFDLAHGFLAHAYGRKRVRLFSPAESPHLLSLSDRHDHRSPVDPERPGLDSAHGSIFEIEPGDALYIPPMWWHHVRSLSTAISVNYWWRPRFEECLTPNGIRALRECFPPHRTWSIARLCDLGGVADPLDLARVALDRGEPWLAVLLIGESGDEAERRIGPLLARARGERFAAIPDDEARRALDAQV
jgi:hypothetical protein